MRQHVLDALTPDQLGQLATITAALLTRLDPPAASPALTDHEEPAPAALPARRLPRPVPAPSPDIAPDTTAASRS